jgi:hypothetical protein
MQTAYAAPPLSDQIAANDDLPPVWPDSEGDVRGVALEPLHKGAPKASRRDPVLAGGVRPTKDVDAIVDVTSYAEYTALAERLRALGLHEEAHG